MNKIKMIVGDLDGTILDSRKQISPEMKRMRNQLRQQEILFVIATARSVASAAPYIIKLEPDYIISCDGGLISSGEENIFVNSMTDTQFVRLFDRIRDSDEIGKISIVSTKNDYSNYNKGKTFPSQFEPGIIKVICEVLSENMLKTLQKENEDLLLSYYDRQVWVRFSNKKATKYSALCQLCQSVGLSTDRVLAFGDDCNDIEMLAHCGIGVAVSNAIATAKAVSNYITADNNSDGVAVFIKEYFGYK